MDDELRKKVELLLADYSDLKKRVLEETASSVREVGCIAYMKTDYTNIRKQKDIYKKIRNTIELQQLYDELLIAFYNDRALERRIG